MGPRHAADVRRHTIAALPQIPFFRCVFGRERQEIGPDPRLRILLSRSRRGAYENVNDRKPERNRAAPVSVRRALRGRIADNAVP
jgi:hypothetical protein